MFFTSLSLLTKSNQCFPPFSNTSGEQQVNNAFYNCIDSTPDIPEPGKTVPLGLDMVGYSMRLSILLWRYKQGISLGKRSAGVSGAIGRHNLNDEDLVSHNSSNVKRSFSMNF